MAGVGAKVLVRVDGIALPDNETAKRPVALADLKFSTTGVIEFVETPDGDFLFSDHCAFASSLS